MTVTIYHNPACGTSRNTLAMIRQSGEDPVIIEYLKTPPTRVRLREKEALCRELGLFDPDVSDDRLLDAMTAHPVLINRPIVETPKGVRLCRPSELVLDLLPDPVTTFVKEDGETVRAVKP
jgi:arsenate reductase